MGVVAQVVVEDFFGDVFEGAGEVDVFFPRGVGVRSTGDGVGGHFGSFPIVRDVSRLSFLYLLLYTPQLRRARFLGKKKENHPHSGGYQQHRGEKMKTRVLAVPGTWDNELPPPTGSCFSA